MNPGKKVSKKEVEKQREKQEAEKAKEALREFEEIFQESSGGINKAWVKGGIVQDKDGKSIDSQNGNGSKLYKPSSRLLEQSDQSSDSSSAVSMEKKPVRPHKKDEKRKSNLELFKEELRQMQEERQERREYKNRDGDSRRERDDNSILGPWTGPPPKPNQVDRYEYDGPDKETSTNLYINAISPKMTEQQLCEVFGKFGPLASVKIMWPRTQDDMEKGKNPGFVAFMNRKDGERALEALQATTLMGFELKLGWGKAVPIPPHPFYIPPNLLALTTPPPPSGLPFNAQPMTNSELRKIRRNKRHQDTSFLNGGLKDLDKAMVKVVMPKDRPLSHLIHRTVEFVVREGAIFEAMIMNREVNNPMYRFLFENQSPEHIYYRWKLYSILHGDTPSNWRTDDFEMFAGGSIWRPPPKNLYTGGAVDPEDKNVDDRREKEKRIKLTDKQRDRFEDMLRSLEPDRSRIADCMVWCLDHAESAEEIVTCIAESLLIKRTPIPKKMARLFLVNDLLYNSSARVQNASYFRKGFFMELPRIFTHLHSQLDLLESRMSAEEYKHRILTCFRAWEDWAVYPNDFLIRMQNVFLGLIAEEDAAKETVDIDGAPLQEPSVEDEPVKDPSPREVDSGGNDEVDGVPMEDVFEETPLEEEKPVSPEKMNPGFVSSKWEEIDESDILKQSMTTSKWDTLVGVDDDDALDGKPFSPTPSPKPEEAHLSPSSDSLYIRTKVSEERRQRLREIELKVVKYQDDVESGRRARKSGFDLHQQVEQYREKLLSKENNTPKCDTPKLRDGKKDRKERSPGSRRSRTDLDDSWFDSPSEKESRRSRRDSGDSSERRYRQKRSRSRSGDRRKHKRKKSRH